MHPAHAPYGFLFCEDSPVVLLMVEYDSHFKTATGELFPSAKFPPQHVLYGFQGNRLPSDSLPLANQQPRL